MPHCPKCRAEYRHGVKICFDCCVPLVGEPLKGEIRVEESVEIYTCPTRVEAEWLKAILEEESIECNLCARDSSVFPGGAGAPGEVTLIVRKNDAERASELINQAMYEQAAPPEDDGDSEASVKADFVVLSDQDQEATPGVEEKGVEHAVGKIEPKIAGDATPKKEDENKQENEEGEIARFSAQEVYDEAVSLLSQRPSTLKKLLLFIITLGLFVALGGGFYSSLDAAFFVSICMIIFVHEMGHYLAMKYFNYSSVGILFIPLIGGAAYGRKSSPYGWQDAVVYLAGPIGGILFAVIPFTIFLSSRSEFAGSFAEAALIINLFNLLPLYPLDGGRLFVSFFTARNYIVEILFIYLMALLFLLGLFFMQEWWLFGFFLFVLTARLPRASRVAGAAAKTHAAIPDQQILELKITPELVDLILRKSDEIYMKRFPTAKALAPMVLETWERVNSVKIPAATIIVLLIVYLSSIFWGVVLLSLLA
ncbi:MAG: hypothetical protein C4523_21200 [Myxococcales bacterium]|nr:MAG: hypothetical protein C4523_21200 [Myxococcales bacterium]